MLITTAYKLHDNINQVAYFTDGREVEFTFIDGKLSAPELTIEERNIIKKQYETN